jgi:phage terminase large subunit GpA-like protein
MDAGCVVSWESCFSEGEASAIQHAYNFLIDDGPDIFATECQNEPPKQAGDEGRLTAQEICSRLNKLDRLKFPREVEHVTAYIDVQGSLLYYVVTAWAQDFTGYVIDYGSFPDQRRRYYTLKDATRTLDAEFPGQPIETQWTLALEKLTLALAGRQWERMDGTTLRMGKVIIDANYGESTKAVKRFCLTSPYSAILQASHGKGIQAGDSPMGMWPVQQGEKRGHNWMLRPDKEAKGLRHLLIDTNFWKSFVHKRLRLLPSSRGSLSLWGNEPRTHEMIADHLTAEYAVLTSGRNRELEEWSEKPGKPDNHLLDCLVGSAVGASMLGAMIGGQSSAPTQRQRMSFAQMKGKN